MNKHPIMNTILETADMWKYKTLERPKDASKFGADSDSAASIYRGIVPAANILNHDFALNGAVVRP